MPHRPAGIALLLAVSCASTRPPTPPTPTAPAGLPPAVAASELPALTPAALRVMRGDGVACTLRPDGAITVDGAPFGRMEARRVVATDGRPLATLSPDGTLRFEGSSRPAHLRPDGAIEGPDGDRMSVGDDGRVVFFDPAHPNADFALRVRVEGVTAPSRAAATVLVTVLMFRGRALPDNR